MTWLGVFDRRLALCILVRKPGKWGGGAKSSPSPSQRKMVETPALRGLTGTNVEDSCHLIVYSMHVL